MCKDFVFNSKQASISKPSLTILEICTHQHPPSMNTSSKTNHSELCNAHQRLTQTPTNITLHVYLPTILTYINSVKPDTNQQQTKHHFTKRYVQPYGIIPILSSFSLPVVFIFVIHVQNTNKESRKTGILSSFKIGISFCFSFSMQKRLLRPKIVAFNF